MSKIAVTALSLLLAAGSAHAADESPPSTPHTTEKMAIGGVLLGLGSATAVSASVVGGYDLIVGFACGLGESGNGCSSAGQREVSELGNAAIGLAVASAVMIAVGAPLVSSARGDEHKKERLRFGLAPMVGPQGGGVSASLAMHF